MDHLKELASIFMLFIRAGVVTRVAYCFVRMVGNEDELSVYKRRIKNAIVFFVLAESVWKLKDLVVFYFT